MAFYIVRSTMILENRFSIRHGGNFVFRGKIIFHAVHSKAVINNRLRMSGGGKVVIKDKEVNDSFLPMTVVVLRI